MPLLPLDFINYFSDMVCLVNIINYQKELYIKNWVLKSRK